MTVIIFMAALGFLSVLLFALPKRAGELDPLEFRALANDPFRDKSASTLMTELVRGDMSKNVDKFLEDHYPARSFFIALNSYYLRFTGRNADQAVVMGRNGRLFDKPLDPTSVYIEKNVSKINAFSGDNGLKTVIAVVPSAAETAKEDLPAVHLNYFDGDIVAAVREKTDAYVPDIAGMFNKRAGEYLMYRTDHHWTMAGAYEVYTDIMEHFGEEPVNRDGFKVESYEFYGSYYRKAGLWLTKPDALEVWTSPELDRLTTKIGWGERTATYSGVYDRGQLKDGNVDKYAAYLWSNNAITVIENPEGNGKTVMLVKDSFGNSIAPLLALTYSRVVMIDTRYYNSPDLPLPSELVTEFGIEELIVVLGADSAVSDIMIAFLR
ncbi:MAG: hypothetical protein K6F68_00790 [Clostridiales bacterium]|nr:hypothetical protein [Clostridiales bacterium]